MPVIFVKDLHKRYAGFDPVLSGVEMEAEAGEMVAIMGPSGCGKSTMLHILGMLHAPDSGRLEVLGTDVFSLDRVQTAAFRRTNMGFVMQSSNLFDHSTVFENVEFPLIYEGIPPQERWERVIQALDLVRLSARVHYRSNRLSGGEQQRAAIARAMVNNPRILLADEPTGALDARTSRHIMENFRNLCHTGGVCLVMVTHDPTMAEYCDTIYTLEDGQLHCKRRNFRPLESGEASYLLEQPQSKRGAFVTERFSGIPGSPSTQAAELLHAGGLLMRIYSLRDGVFSNPDEAYTMPLAVRAAGHSRFTTFFSALWRTDKSGHSAARDVLAKMGGEKAPLRLLQEIGSGMLLAQWAAEDKIAFFVGGPGYLSAAATCAAADFAGLPFALIVSDDDAVDGKMLALAKKARCICCMGESPAWRHYLAELVDFSEDRYVFLPEKCMPDPSRFSEEEASEDVEQETELSQEDKDRNSEMVVDLTPGQQEALARIKDLLLEKGLGSHV